MPAPTLMELIQASVPYLEQRGVENARREVEWLFAEVLKCSRLELYTRATMPVEEREVGVLRDLVARRGKREPLAYLLGTQPFCGLELAVGPEVLVPRPETEQLVDLALADCSEQASVADVGTGSGAIALAVASKRPQAAVQAIDISQAALQVAQANAERHQLSVTFHRGHLAQPLTEPVDVVIANLPYVAAHERGLCDEETAYEPASALFAGADGLDLIRELVADLPRCLTDKGVAWFEHGFAQSEPVIALAEEQGLHARSEKDFADHLRFTRIARDG